jgi:3-hydroxyisobutyrate dehydrogenase
MIPMQNEYLYCCICMVLSCISITRSEWKEFPVSHPALSNTTSPSIAQPLPITVLGLGAMGWRMAARLLSTGHAVTVWNRSPEPSASLRALGALVTESPVAAVSGARVVVSMLTDDNAAREVWITRGAASALRSDAVAVECSTVTPEWTRELATAVARTGASLVEAPVVGSRPQAEAGQLIMLLAGRQRDIAIVSSALTACASTMHTVHASEGENDAWGKAATAKLAVNGYFAAQVVAIAEALEFLAKSGMSKARAAELFAQMPVVAPPLANAARSMANESFSPLFPVRLVEKDLRYLRQAANRAEAPSQLAATVHGAFERAVASGGGEEHITAVIKSLGAVPGSSLSY